MRPQKRMFTPHHLTVALAMVLATSPVDAYVGPGLGLGVLGVLLGALVAVFLAIAGLFWYPIKRFWKKSKLSKDSDDKSAGEKSQQENADDRDKDKEKPKSK